MDTRTSRSARAGRTVRVRVARTAVAVMAAVAVLAVQPVPARADVFGNSFFPAHWGPNPHIAVPTTSPYYRSVALIDNTGDPSLSQQIQLFAQILNAVHNGYNSNYPVFLYYKDVVFGGNPCGLGPQQFLVVCKDETLGGGSPGAPGSAAIFPSSPPQSHIFYAVARVRPSVTDSWCAGDKFTLVVQLISNSLGLDQNLTNSASALFPTIPIGRCTMNGWTQAELDRLNLMYSHSAG